MILSEGLASGEVVLEGHDVQRKEQNYGYSHLAWFVVDGYALPKTITPLKVELQVG